jgi:uncharacterized protein (DUF934 family)
MAQLIKNQTVAVDAWKTLELAEGETPEAWPCPLATSFSRLPSGRRARPRSSPATSASACCCNRTSASRRLPADLDYFIVIAVNFPKFVDGRGYSTASLLRQRYNYQGELRAVGDVLHDQLFFMQRVGFDAYALKDEKNAVYALEAGFSPFSDTYQTSTSQPQPHFRRRA